MVNYVNVASQNEVEAVVAQNPTILSNIVERLQAVQSFAALPESASLAAANKRITNILKKAEGTPGEINPSLLQKLRNKLCTKPWVTLSQTLMLPTLPVTSLVP